MRDVLARAARSSKETVDQLGLMRNWDQTLPIPIPHQQDQLVSRRHSTAAWVAVQRQYGPGQRGGLAGRPAPRASRLLKAADLKRIADSLAVTADTPAIEPAAAQAVRTESRAQRPRPGGAARRGLRLPRPNGAGKTTTSRCCSAWCTPTSGEARLFGEPWATPRTAPHRLPARELPLPRLDHRRAAARLPRSTRRPDRRGTPERIPHVLEQVGLAGRGDDRIRGYSKGMTQRIGLAQAIIHDPTWCSSTSRPRRSTRLAAARYAT